MFLHTPTLTLCSLAQVQHGKQTWKGHAYNGGYCWSGKAVSQLFMYTKVLKSCYHFFYQVVIIFWQRNELNAYPSSQILRNQFLLLEGLQAVSMPILLSLPSCFLWTTTFTPIPIPFPILLKFAWPGGCNNVLNSSLRSYKY